jgi:hypothetical protein
VVTNYVFPSAQVGEFRTALLYANGPTSYGSTGDVVYNPGANEYINFPSDCTSASGNFRVRFQPTSTGLNIVRAGAPSPSQSGWTAIWEYSGQSNQAENAIPVGLGALSAAATQSAMTANGVVTVTGANTLSPGQFVLLTNGTTATGIFMNGAIVQITAATPTTYTFNFAQAKALNYAAAADTLKYQVLNGGSPGNLVTLGTAAGQSIAVSAIAIASYVITITCVNTGITVKPGMFIVLQGLAAGEVGQGGIIQVLTASATTLTGNLLAPNLSVTSGETATATVLVTNGNAPITTNDSAYTISGSTVAATAASASAAGAITACPVTQSFVPGNIVVVQGLTHGSTLNGLITAVLSTSLTATNVTTNGYIRDAVTTGTSDTGIMGLLVTGTPANGMQVAPGTNLSGESVQFQALISSL